MAEIETSGYAIIEGAVRKIKIFPGGVIRSGKRFVIAIPHNPKKQEKLPRTGAEKRLLIDPEFVSTSMADLTEKARTTDSETLRGQTTWSTQ